MTPPPIGFICYPNIRSIAYLNIFRDLQVLPSEIIVMDGDIPKLNELRNESRQYDYSGQYFDLELSLEKFLAETPVTHSLQNTRNINDDKIRNVLLASRTETWIFSGGGLVSNKIFATGKKFIHIHPGRIPEYRGSTTFYYSLLQENSLTATAFFMKKELDMGDSLAEENFRVNLSIDPQQQLFMDYVLDPYIRAQTLRSALESFTTKNRLSLKPAAPPAKNPYFIIHPLLRQQTIRNINCHYDKKQPAGIFRE